MIYPPLLQKGDTVAVAAASGSCTNMAHLTQGVKTLEAWGLNVRVMASCYASHGTYLAGSDRLRANDLHHAFADPTIRGIIMARGGYGAARLLPLLDYDLIRKNPKVFVGFSDVTALHTAFNQICNMATFHGPMVASCLGKENVHPFTLAALRQGIMGDTTPQRAAALPLQYLGAPNTPLSIKGVLTGGNLSVITSLLGTPYAIQPKKRLLFLEETNEPPYRVDRMFIQLKLSGKLREAAAIILGDFSPESQHTLEIAIREVILPEGVPTFAGLPCGHTAANATLNLGATYAIHVSEQGLTS